MAPMDNRVLPCPICVRMKEIEDYPERTGSVLIKFFILGIKGGHLLKVHGHVPIDGLCPKHQLELIDEYNLKMGGLQRLPRSTLLPPARQDLTPPRTLDRQCAVGLYVGVRSFPQQGGAQVGGVFGKIGLEEPCSNPVTARCQLLVNGRLAPYYWLACDLPEHRQDAGVIEHLDPQGRVLRVERVRQPPTEAEVIGTVLAAGAAIVAAIGGQVAAKKTRKPRIPRNKPKRLEE